MSLAPCPTSRNAKQKAEYRDRQRHRKQVMMMMALGEEDKKMVEVKDEVGPEIYKTCMTDLIYSKRAAVIKNGNKPLSPSQMEEFDERARVNERFLNKQSAIDKQALIQEFMAYEAEEEKQYKAYKARAIASPEEHYMKYGETIGYQKLKCASDGIGKIWSQFSKYPVGQEQFYQVVERLNILLMRIHASGARERIAFKQHMGDDIIPPRTEYGEKLDAERLHQMWKVRWEAYQQQYIDVRTGYNKSGRNRFYNAVQRHIADSHSQPEGQYTALCMASLAKPTFDNHLLKLERIHRAVLCEEALSVYTILSGMCCMVINNTGHLRPYLFSCDMIGISSTLNVPFEYKTLSRSPCRTLDIPYHAYSKLVGRTDKSNYYRDLLRLFPVYGQQVCTVSVSVRSINCIRGTDQTVSYGNVVANLQ